MDNIDGVHIDASLDVLKHCTSGEADHAVSWTKCRSRYQDFPLTYRRRHCYRLLRRPCGSGRRTYEGERAVSQQITVDMGSSQRVAGFTYLPRQDATHDGVVETYRFETSADGQKWTTNVDSARFANIENNPVLQEVPFAPTIARYTRFTALKVLGANGTASVAGISVLTAESEGQQ